MVRSSSRSSSGHSRRGQTYTQVEESVERGATRLLRTTRAGNVRTCSDSIWNWHAAAASLPRPSTQRFTSNRRSFDRVEGGEPIQIRSTDPNRSKQK